MWSGARGVKVGQEGWYWGSLGGGDGGGAAGPVRGFGLRSFLALFRGLLGVECST